MISSLPRLFLWPQRFCEKRLMSKLRRNDIVQVVTGKDRGKKGKMLDVLSMDNRAIVEGINLVKKHRRKTQQDQQGKIVQIPSPIHMSNLRLICKNCNKLTRAGFIILKNGVKSRICKKCKQPV